LISTPIPRTVERVKARGLRLDVGTLIVLAILVVVIAALLSGFDVINGGYSQADIKIGF
jgi:hypothetical protein